MESQLNYGKSLEGRRALLFYLVWKEKASFNDDNWADTQLWEVSKPVMHQSGREL